MSCSIRSLNDFFWISIRFGISRTSRFLENDILTLVPSCCCLTIQPVTPFIFYRFAEKHAAYAPKKGSITHITVIIVQFTILSPKSIVVKHIFQIFNNICPMTYINSSAGAKAPAERFYCLLQRNSSACAAQTAPHCAIMIAGRPSINERCLVLCRISFIHTYIATLPPQAASRKSVFSGA